MGTIYLKKELHKILLKKDIPIQQFVNRVVREKMKERFGVDKIEEIKE